jgi:hypothetical protein
MFVDCPAYMSGNGSVRCGLPAEVEGRYTMQSTDGPLESAKIRCPRGHWFNGPVGFLAPPAAGARAGLPDRGGRRGRREGGLGAAA